LVFSGIEIPSYLFFFTTFRKLRCFFPLWWTSPLVVLPPFSPWSLKQGLLSFFFFTIGEAANVPPPFFSNRLEFLKPPTFFPRHPPSFCLAFFSLLFQGFFVFTLNSFSTFAGTV